jgi:hypothetical protein
MARRRNDPAPKPPPCFWDGLCGAVPFEGLPAETRAALAPLFERGQTVDPVDEAREMAKQGGSHDGARGR